MDIIITSVACHDYILDSTALNAILSERGGRPLCVIDIAVPRNVDPDAADLDGITLRNIDDLKAIADENMKSRLSEVETALQIVHADAADLFEWYEGLEMVPMIVRMQQSFEKIREREIEKYRKRRGKEVTDEEMTLVEELTRQIISKILHNPIMAIKENKSLQLQGYHTKEAIKQKIQIIEELFRI
jgi:glutamyl-tRNA reductase